jgi:hypothetical protein
MPKISRWQEGRVDRTKEHFELRYGFTSDSDVWILVAVVGPPVAGIVNVQFLVEPDDPKNADAVSDVKKQIQSYLLELGEPDPWRYAQYHCTTMANVYPRVHWSFFQLGTISQPPSWLRDLRPGADCRLEPVRPHSDVVIWHVPLAFSEWTPSTGERKPTRDETYGKKLIVADNGQWTVAEIALVRRLRDAGWRARWLDTYGRAPRDWSRWIVEPELPLPLREIAKTKPGRPDLVAWRGDSLSDVLFVEYKGPRDKVRDNQEIWFRGALSAGVTRDQLAVATWRAARPSRIVV